MVLLGISVLFVLGACYAITEEKEMERIIRENGGTQVIIIQK